MKTIPRIWLALFAYGAGGLHLPAAPATVPPPAPLLGEWQLTLKARDKNGNGQLDAEERDPQRNVVFTEKDAKDYLRFNRDGTCAFYPHKVQGRFELRPQSSGPPTLLWFDNNNNPAGRGVLNTVNDRELILFANGAFSVFRRL